MVRLRLLAVLTMVGCVQAAPRPVVKSSPAPHDSSPVRVAADGGPKLDAHVPCANRAAPAPDAVRSDGTPYAVLWNWTGTYEFTECGEPGTLEATRCPRYRLVIENCPGACKVYVDVDGPQMRRRFEGEGRGTANRYELEVRFTRYGDDDPSKAGYLVDAVLITLEFQPGNHAMLRFRTLQSTNCIESILVRLKPPFGPSRDPKPSSGSPRARKR